MRQLPTTWLEETLGDVAKVSLGTTPPKKEYRDEGKYKVVKFRDLKDGQVIYSNHGNGYVAEQYDKFSSLRELNVDDVLITSAAHSGENIGKKSAYIDSLPSEYKKVFYTGELLNIRANESTTSKLLYHFFCSNDGFKEIQKAVSGVHLTSGRAKKMRVPLPPLPEQKRIVAKLDQLLPRVKDAQQRLAKIPTLLAEFRQSVLMQAVTGELTKDWREENETESAAILLKNIVAARYKAFENDCEEAKKRGQKKPTLDISTDSPDISKYSVVDIPTTWRWSTVNTFGYVKGGKRLPKGASLVENNTGHPYLRIRDLRDGSVDTSSLLYVPKEIFPLIKNYIINYGDVFLTIVGSIGIAGTIPMELDGANLTENAAKIVQPIGIDPKYLVIWFQSFLAQKIIQQNIHSAGQGKLALFRIEQLPVPLPPSDEQVEIVKRVASLFDNIQTLELRYQKAKQFIDKLEQSILAKAFRGELASQDPNDEPAEELLKRINEASY